MASNYEFHLSPVSLQWRAELVIQADIDAAQSGRATAVAKAKLAAIELLIRRGDRLYRRRNYEAAVKEYKKARAKIFTIIRPKLTLEPYLREKDLLLPLDTKIEKQLMNALPHVINSIRPSTEMHTLQLAPTTAVDVPPHLQAMRSVGFRDVKELDATINQAMTAGYELLVEDKPQAAADIMLAAHKLGSAPNARADQNLMASLELNLSATFAQMGDATQGTKFANSAVKKYRARRDGVGEAQALHALGISQTLAKKPDDAKRSFDAAQARLTRLSPSTVPVIDPVILPRPRPLPRSAALVPGTFARVDFGAVSVLRGRAGTNLERAVIDNQLAPSISKLKNTVGKDKTSVPFRIAGRAAGWGSIDLTTPTHNKQRAKAWNVGIPAGDRVVAFKIGEGQMIAAERIQTLLYAARVNRKKFADLRVVIAGTETTSAYLLQLFAYTLPVKIGNCYHRLGRFNNAEQNYHQAAKYTFLNKHIEASLVWKKLARNALEWGETLYRQERIAQARKQFEKIVKTDGTVPNSFLYTTASLKVPADEARVLISKLSNRPLPRINTGLSITIMQAFSHLASILAGFDYFGLLLSPIHTFEYLQSVASGFCREVIQAEREFINFKSREELETATRRDLDNAVSMAEVEADGRKELLRASEDDERAARHALTLAQQRHADAITQRSQYASSSATQIWAQAASQALMGGEDGMYGEISELADKLARGETISGAHALLAAAQALHAGRKTREYELARMQDTIDQLAQSINVAQSQLNASQHRANVAELAWQAALERVEMAKEALDAFDDEFFTPDAWSAMADVMRDISKSYLYRAMRIAKLMERAYNFENDVSLRVIKSEYGHGVANEAPGRDTRLLAGDALLADVESFIYHAITNTTRKNSRIKDVVSVLNDFPAQYEAFLNTGLLQIETDLYEFDRLHPGFYEQRIEAIEVEVIGVLGAEGINGTLTGGGVTSFRRRNNTEGSRAHILDTLAISDFELRNDVFLYTSDTGVRGLFQGLGVGGTWSLHLPRRSNDLDLRRIFDIRLSFYYKAKYDPGLRSTVLALPVRPGELTQQRSFALRFDFPAAWYAFYKTGSVTAELNVQRFPANQENFIVQAMRARVMTKTGIADTGIQVRITAPDATVVTGTTAAGGLISTEDVTLASLIGKVPLGNWQIEVLAGASLMNNGALDFSRVHNIQLSFDYGFAYLAEAI